MTTPPFGLMDQAWAAPEQDDRETLDEVLSTVRLADRLGFASAWIGEHHHVRDGAPFWGRVSATEVVLGYAAAKTRRIALGAGVRVLSTTTALRTAEEICQLAVLTGGRIDFGIGLGSGQPGIKSRDEKAAEFRNRLDDLLGALADDGSTGLPPLSPRAPVDLKPRLWAAARDAATIEHLARRGVNLVMGQAELPSVQAGYVRRYRAAGGSGSTRGVRLVFVAETHAEAIEKSRAAADLYFSLIGNGPYYKEAVAKGLLPEIPPSREAMLDSISFVVGTPDKVVADLNAYLAETGVDRLDAMMRIPRLALADVHRGMALMMDAVIPRLVYPPATARPVAAAAVPA